MKILVTGGCGFIGHNVCLSLMTKGHQVICADIVKAPFVDQVEGLEFLQADLFSDVSQKTFSCFPDGIDVIVHLASTSIPETANMDMYKDAKDNVLGSLRLLNFAAESNAKLFIYTSSGGTVYGPQDAEQLSEGLDKNPICCYGATKLAVESYMRIYRKEHGICTLALRLANPYGRFQRIDAKQGIIPIFCRKALLNEEIMIFGDGTAERDFVHVDDVCSAIDRAIDTYLPKFQESCDIPSEVNIGSGRGTTLNEILCTISKYINRELRIRYADSRSFDVKKNVLDISLAKKALAWSPTIKLDKGIQLLIDCFRSQLKV